MSDYLPRAGVVPEQHPVLNRWTELQLDALDRHFAAHPFLFGGRPSLGDFGLMGPLYGHLSRDPWPARHLIAPRTHLVAWLERMNRSQPAPGEFLANDAMPTTLDPLLDSVFGEMLPYLEGMVRVAQAEMQKPDPLPRFMNDVDFPMGKGRYRRPAMPYALWMLQRALDVVRAMPPSDATGVRAWLARHGVERLLEMQVPRLRRVGLRAAPVLPKPEAAPTPALAETE